MKNALQILLVLLSYSVFAHSAPTLQMICSFSNSRSSVSDNIELEDGMVTPIHCPGFSACSDSRYKITMNYNSLYENVTVSVADSVEKKMLNSEHHISPTLVGGLPGKFVVTYSEIKESKDAAKKGNSKGSKKPLQEATAELQLSIDCERF